MIVLMGTTRKSYDAPEGSWMTGYPHLRDFALSGTRLLVGQRLAAYLFFFEEKKLHSLRR